MKKIKLLPENIINKIAAGEIIERPFSVVKELIENSIDAKATKIKVEVKNGGKKLIKVVDNGEGVDRDDLFLAFERHATSKIKNEKDLEKISTLGFRGEALPSIASVSKVRAASKTKDSDIGFEIILEGGKVKNLNEITMNNGFIIEVKDLFFNLPVRKKFLKRDETEFFYIESIFKKFTFVYPEIEFTLIHNGRKKYFFPIVTKYIDRIYEILDEKVAGKLIPFQVENEEIYIRGFISTPDVTVPNTKEINIFVNGRFVKDRIILSAIKDALKNKIEQGKYPYAIIYLNIPYEKVDVNIHPTKLEVKFENPQFIYNTIKNAISNIFIENLYYNEDSIVEEEEKFNFDKIKNFFKESVSKYISTKREENIFFEPIEYDENQIVKKDIFQDKGFFSKMKIVGSLFDTFIILENNDEFYLIDQHAAHERINFEKLKKQILENRIEIKKFLIPEIIEISGTTKKLLELYYDKLKDFGIIIEKFDNESFVLKGIPAVLENIEINDFINELLNDIHEIGSSLKTEELINTVLSTIACKSSIKANIYLDFNGIKSLISELDNTPNNFTCPHGRPIFKKFNKDELYKWFKRI